MRACWEKKTHFWRRDKIKKKKKVSTPPKAAGRKGAEGDLRTGLFGNREKTEERQAKRMFLLLFLSLPGYHQKIGGITAPYGVSYTWKRTRFGRPNASPCKG